MVRLKKQVENDPGSRTFVEPDRFLRTFLVKDFQYLGMFASPSGIVSGEVFKRWVSTVQEVRKTRV
jgi:hypothetical protein